MNKFESKTKIHYYTSWVIGSCDDELLEYYKWWWKRIKGITLMRPKHGAHISIVRGLEENIKNGWWEKNLDGPIITFQYEPELKEGVGYVWLDVQSKQLEQIRVDLGLDPHPRFGFHFTIGKSPFHKGK